MIRRTSFFRVLSGSLSRAGLRGTLPASLLAAATLSLAAFTLNPVSTVAQAAGSRNAAAASAQESPFHGTVVEDIVARVNDQVISTSDYNHAEQDLEAQAKQRNWSQAELDDQKSQLLRDLIDNQLLLSKGKQLGISGEAETIRQLDELRKQNHLDSMEALEKAAEQQGVDFADFKASIQNRVITSQVIRDEVGRRINITHGEEQQYYDEHRDQFSAPEEVKLSEILIPTADPDNAAQVAAAQTKADAVEADLKSGKDFATLAKADSGNPTAAQGGVLGEYKRGQLAKVLEDDTFSLKPGEFTAPVRTKQGFVILRVDAHNPGGVQPFASVQPQVEDALGMQKMQPALRQYLTQLREEAYIDVRPGYHDLAASKGETHPIFSAYAPPQPKKKKKHEARSRFSDSNARTRNSVIAAKRNADTTTPKVPPPAGVPSLADVSSGKASSMPAANTTQTARVRTLKPGKKEKVRYGQAPRETLPAATAHEEDAGASTANGNGSTSETANVAEGGVSVPAGAHYENGDSAGEEQVAAKKVKTRFSQRGEQDKKAKVEKKRKAAIDPYPNPPADSQEIADRKEQSQPLGLAGDTSKKPPKPKPTGIKTRYSDEAGKKPVPADTSTPAVTTQPYREPSSEATPNATAPSSSAPVPAQTTPTGSGDPMGPTTPPPSPPQQPQQR
jgi:peptidyl-prolyl cis-trans isomerase SurA